MDTLKINTSQNISIEQSIASIGERIAATSIDLLIMISFSIVIMLTSGGLHLKQFAMVGIIPVMMYSLLSELAMDGQSWGKKIMKIKVIKIDGSATTFSSYFLRWIISMVEVFTFLGSLAIITILLNQKGQRLGDIAANTTVIRLRNKSMNQNLMIQLPDEYEMVYPEVSKLSMTDISIIQEVLETLKDYDSEVPKMPLAKKAHKAIEQKMNITATQKTIPFFETILSDYNYLNSRNS